MSMILSLAEVCRLRCAIICLLSFCCALPAHASATESEPITDFTLLSLICILFSMFYVPRFNSFAKEH